MSISTLVLGESGTGKSTSMRNMNPEKTLLIQSIAKPLPFRSSEWKKISKESPTGNVFVTDNYEQIISIMVRTQRKIIVIDDFQYVLANEFMRRAKETGFGKFTDIGCNAWKLLTCAASLPDDKRVYILSHTESDALGNVKIKTIGRMLDEKITVEGMFSIVLRTMVQDGQYKFSTQNNGSDTVKSPMGLFENQFIDNDLEMIDSAICDYYSISKTQEIKNDSNANVPV